MTLPSLTLKKALYDRLRADPDVTALVGARIYDEVPRGPGNDVRTTKPYISLGEDEVLADKAECLDGAEVTLTVHAWSAGPGDVEVKRITAAVKAAIDGAEDALALAGQRLILIEFETARHLREPDGITRHGVVTFRALTERV